MEYYSKYLKYKNKYLNLKSQTGGLKTITKAIVSGIQVVGEKTVNEVNCRSNLKNKIEIIAEINNCRNYIINMFTPKYYRYISKNASRSVSDFKDLMRLIIEVVNGELRQVNKRIFSKSFTSYVDYTALEEIFYELRSKETATVGVYRYEFIIKNIIDNHKEIKENAYFILNNLQCMCRNQLIPVFDEIKCDNTSENENKNENENENENENKNKN